MNWMSNHIFPAWCSFNPALSGLCFYSCAHHAGRSPPAGQISLEKLFQENVSAAQLPNSSKTTVVNDGFFPAVDSVSLSSRSLRNYKKS